MNPISDKDILEFQKHLAVKLVDLSNGALYIEQAKIISEKVCKTIDLNNDALNHKGINWIAKEVISKIDFTKLTS